MGLGGPKTDAGKAVSSRNALRHGLLSESPLATCLEKADHWEAHRQGVLDDLRPRGQMETCLAERAALLIWRLRRVARAEVEAIDLSQEAVETDYARPAFFSDPRREHPENLRCEVHDLDRAAEMNASLPALPVDAPLDPDVAVDLCDLVLDAAGLDSEKVDPPMLPDGEAWEEIPWTAGLLRECLAWAAGESNRSEDAFTAEVHDRIAAKSAAAAARLERAEQDVDAMRRARILPPEHDLQRLARYEAHLGRELARTMRALRELQTRAAASPPAHPSHSSPDGSERSEPSDGSDPAPSGGSRIEAAAATPAGHDLQNCETNPPAGLGAPAAAGQRLQNCETNPAPGLGAPAARGPAPIDCAGGTPHIPRPLVAAGAAKDGSPNGREADRSTNRRLSSQRRSRGQGTGEGVPRHSAALWLKPGSAPCVESSDCQP